MPTEPATIRELQDEVRRLSIAAQMCLTPDAGRKPKGLNVERALIHLELIQQHAVAALRLLDEAQRPLTSVRTLDDEGEEILRLVQGDNRLVPDPDPVCSASSTEGANE